jgi:predicted Fe-Mo cluster-binding NifX family protein
MKIALSATGKNLNSSIDERFGRCRYYLIVETNDMSHEALENTNADLSTSAGIQSAALVASKGVEAVITGNCGPKAMQVFDSAHITVITGQRGTVNEVVEQFKNGRLQPSADTHTIPVADVSADEALRTGRPGGGRGMGGCGRGVGAGGRGMGGGGMGMGMGRRCNRSYGVDASAAQRPLGQAAGENELAHLRQQADQLNRQLQAIQSRINDLDEGGS